MSIVKMKKLRMIALAGERDEILARLLHVGCVEVSEPQVEMNDPEWTDLLRRSDTSPADAKQELAQVLAALQTLSKYSPAKGGLFRVRKPVAEDLFLCPDALAKATAQAEEINLREREIASIQNQQARLAARKLALTPWAGLDIDLDTRSTKNVLISLSVCPAGVDMDALRADLTQAAPTAQVIEASTDREQHYFLWLCHTKEETDALAVMKSFGVSPAGLKGFTGTAADNIAAVEAEETTLAGRKQVLVSEITAMADCRGELEVTVDRLQQEVAKAECARRALTDDTIIFFTGWVSAPELPELEKELARFTCAWETSDPDPDEYPEVPIKLKNNWLTRPLTMVTEMYSLPAYGTVDPNPLMAPFFILFYGIMLADMGYGLLMILAGLIVSKKFRPKGTMGHMFNLATLCGISTFVVGAITGGFFGDFPTQVIKILFDKDFALPALFTPLNDTLMILIGSIALGAVHIITGMAVSFVQKIKAGEIMDAIWEEVTWWVVFAGLALMILGVTPIVLAVGGVMIVVGSGWNAKGFGKVTAIFGSLYNHITGFFGDLLSYSRLMALMLAGSVIAQVFNTLGAIPGNIVIFLIISLAGNALNFALNLLGCYVHDLRLQCLEYFGKFYQDGGRPFKPLAFNTKYVDVINK